MKTQIEIKFSTTDLKLALAQLDCLSANLEDKHRLKEIYEKVVKYGKGACGAYAQSDADVVVTIQNIEETWSELRINYYDEEEGCICVDAFESDDENAECVVIAKVFKDRVEYLDNRARYNPNVLEMVVEATRDIYTED